MSYTHRTPRTPPTSPPRRSAVGIVVVGTALGLATGAVLGGLAALALLLSDPTTGFGPELAALVVYIGLGVWIGATVGAVEALLTSVVLALARPLIGDRLGVGRLVAGSAAGLLALTALVPAAMDTSTGRPVTEAALWWVIRFAGVCAAGAAGWAGRVLGRMSPR